jgi:hypothetical protein
MTGSEILPDNKIDAEEAIKIRSVDSSNHNTANIVQRFRAQKSDIVRYMLA